MLRAKPFLIITDCEPVTYMMEKEGSRSTRMAAWALELQAFSFTLMHRPGDRNTNADALSRLAIKDNAADIRLLAADPTRSNLLGRDGRGRGDWREREPRGRGR